MAASPSNELLMPGLSALLVPDLRANLHGERQRGAWSARRIRREAPAGARHAEPEPQGIATHRHERLHLVAAIPNQHPLVVGAVQPILLDVPHGEQVGRRPERRPAALGAPLPALVHPARMLHERETGELDDLARRAVGPWIAGGSRKVTTGGFVAGSGRNGEAASKIDQTFGVMHGR